VTAASGVADPTGTMLHLPPGQWWSTDGWLHMEAEEIDGHGADEGWVLVRGQVHRDGKPAEQCTVPVRQDALATPDAREPTQLLRDHATRWLVQYLTGVGGRARVADIKRAAEGVGLTYRTVRRVSAADDRIGRGGDHWWLAPNQDDGEPNR
jgi:hypothetical protein